MNIHTEMGVSGTLEYLSDLMSSGHHHKKKKQLQTVELKVRMDCDGCELKVKKALSSLSGEFTFFLRFTPLHFLWMLSYQPYLCMSTTSTQHEADEMKS